MIGILRRWRLRRAVERTVIDPALWSRVVDSITALDGMDAATLERLRALAVAFLHDKEIAGAQGFEPNDEVRLSIALQACLPILELGLDAYDGFVGVVVHPGEFRVRREEVDEAGVQHEWEDDLSGEVWPGGPVVLSWEDVRLSERGYNVVIHEFAHRLDMLTGDADGYPPAPAGFDPAQWRFLLEESYVRFCRDTHDLEARTPPRIREVPYEFDPYGTEHPAEFFAVMSEAFFTEPHRLKARYPDLYDALGRFYRQDPAARMPQ